MVNLFYSRKFLKFALLANVSGFIYGIYYYRYQFANTPVYFWLFVPDCPLASLFASIAIYLLLKNKISKSVVFLASASTIKYGFWTVFVILYHSSYFLSGEYFTLYSLLWVSHLLLFFEGFLISTFARFNFKDSLVSLIYLPLNDFFDYWFHTHPYMPEKNIELIALLTFSLTFISIFSTFYFSKLFYNPAGNSSG